jgi:hypothetical protein
MGLKSRDLGGESFKPTIQKTIYDSAKAHFLGNFPETLPIERAYLHIGMYMGWIIEKGLYSAYFEDESEHQMYQFVNKNISCTILSEIWDGYLGYELFSKQGNMFTYYYYAGGLYKIDYEKTLACDLPSIYHVTDTWENYEKIKKVIDQRFEEWKKLVNQ